MVVISLPTVRSHILMKCCKILKKRRFCTSTQARDVNKPEVQNERNPEANTRIDIKPSLPSVNYHYDIDEVKHHETMAKEWWDPKGSMKALHAMNDLRIPFIKNGLVNSHRLKALEVKDKVKFLEGVNILDVGCGGGILSEVLARLGGRVTGIDPSESLISVARTHSLNLKDAADPPTYVVSTVEQHVTGNMGTYDAVVASEVIEHVTDKESFLAASIAALKLGGSLFITTPNRTLASWVGGVVLAENVLNIVPKGTHNHSKFINPDELSVLLEKYGCSIQLVNGMFYDPLRNKWMWSPTKAFIYALHAIKIKDLLK